MTRKIHVVLNEKYNERYLHSKSIINGFTLYVPVRFWKALWRVSTDF